MNRERAESYLRRLAEAERRRMMALPADRFRDQWYSRRLALVAQALGALGAVDAGTAKQIQTEFDVASTMRLLSLLNAAGPGPGGLSPDVREQLERLKQVQLVQLAQADDPVIPVSGPAAGQVGSRQATRVVPVGQVIPVPMLGGAVILLAYLQGPDGARFILANGMAGSPHRRGPAPGPATQPQQGLLAVADDQGTSYQPIFSGVYPGPGELLLRPVPPHQIRWLDFTPAPGEPVIRIDLGPQDRQLPAPDVTVTSKAHSPGELLLEVIAIKILTLAADFPQDDPEQLAAATREVRSFAAEGLGDLVAALQAADVLSAVSPVPGQLAGLCARLGLGGHGITASPADLPEPWESVLTRYHRRPSYQPPAPGSWAVQVAGVPELDGTRVTIFGLYHGDAHTMILHTLVSGVTMEDDWKYARVVRPLPVFWIQDDSGRWHTTETYRISHPVVNGEVVLWLRIWPPLDRDTTWIDVVATGRSAEARATVPLRWK